MKSIGLSVSVVMLAVSAAAGCNGKLEVGDDRRGQKVNEGDSGSTSGGGEGGATPNTTEGAGGVSGSGGSSASTTGSWTDRHPPIISPEASSSEGCPMGPLEPDSACETEGLTCRYYADPPKGSGEECFCIRASDDRQIWYCHFPGQINETCPNDRPWDCPVTHRDLPDPPQAEVLDPGRIVAELTDEERETWCEWYTLLNWNDADDPPVADRPVEDGYAAGPACIYNGMYCHAAAPILSKADCVKNLSLSECRSPLSNLTDCAIDVLGYDCGPFDYGCLDYLEASNCEGTIIHPFTDDLGSIDCGVRVE